MIALRHKLEIWDECRHENKLLPDWRVVKRGGLCRHVVSLTGEKRDHGQGERGEVSDSKLDIHICTQRTVLLSPVVLCKFCVRQETMCNTQHTVATLLSKSVNLDQGCKIWPKVGQIGKMGSNLRLFRIQF